MLTRPGDLTDAVLLGSLSDGWDLHVVSLEYRPVGFGSHHWCATDSSSRRWFVTVDDLDAKRNSPDETLDTAFDQLRGALATARAVRDAGAAFVVAPIPTRDGAIVLRVSAGFALALYPYVDGESRSGGYEADSDRLAVLDLIVSLHGAPAALEVSTTIDDFVIAWRGELARALGDLAMPWDQGPYSERARVLLAQYTVPVARSLARYDRLAEQARDLPARRVLTHGEPHIQNVILTTDGWMLIDWDTTMIALPERDLWMLESGNGEVVDRYTKVTGTPVLPSMLDLYRIRWDLTEVAIYTALFRRQHADTEDARESWENLGYYLQRLQADVAPNERPKE